MVNGIVIGAYRDDNLTTDIVYNNETGYIEYQEPTTGALMRTVLDDYELPLPPTPTEETFLKALKVLGGKGIFRGNRYIYTVEFDEINCYKYNDLKNPISVDNFDIIESEDIPSSEDE